MFKVIEEKIAVPLIIILTLFVLGGIYYSVNLAERDFEKATEYAPIKIEKKDPTANGFDELTANWQTYRNEEFGFEVKYPEALQITNEGQTHNPSEVATPWIFSLEMEGDEYTLDVLMNVGKGLICSANQYASYQVEVQDGGNLEIISTEEFDEDAERCDFEGIEQGILLNSGFIYQGQDWWIGLGGEVSREKELKQVFEQILSTFKFIE